MPSNQEDIIEAGNTFSRRFLLGVGLFYALYLTVEPAAHADEVRAVATYRNELRRSAMACGISVDQPASSFKASGPISALPIGPLGTAVKQSGLCTGFQDELSTREKWAKATADLVAIRKSADRQYALPAIPGSLPEAPVVTFLPWVIFGGLLRLLLYRSAFLRTAHTTSTSLFPYWSAPLPPGPIAPFYWKWISINCFGLASVALLMLIGFGLTGSPGFPQFESLKSFGLLLGIVAALSYVVALIRAVAPRRRVWPSA
jgi:hypothetical protein